MTIDDVYLYEGKNSFSFEKNLVCEKIKKKTVHPLMDGQPKAGKKKNNKKHNGRC
jgi:hypothetical protein